MNGTINTFQTYIKNNVLKILLNLENKGNLLNN